MISPSSSRQISQIFMINLLTGEMADMILIPVFSKSSRIANFSGTAHSLTFSLINCPGFAIYLRSACWFSQIKV